MIGTKTFSTPIPLQKNFKVKTFALDAVNSTLPHSEPPIIASGRFLNRGIAETLDFEKTMKVQLENAEQNQVISNK